MENIDNEPSLRSTQCVSEPTPSDKTAEGCTSSEKGTSNGSETSSFDASKAMNELRERQCETQKQQEDQKAVLRVVETMMEKMPEDESQTDAVVSPSRARELAEREIEKNMVAVADSLERHRARSATPTNRHKRKPTPIGKSGEKGHDTTTPSPVKNRRVVRLRAATISADVFNARKAMLELRGRQMESEKQQADLKANMRCVDAMMDRVQTNDNTDDGEQETVVSPTREREMAKARIEENMNSLADSLGHHHSGSSTPVNSQKGRQGVTHTPSPVRRRRDGARQRTGSITRPIQTTVQPKQTTGQESQPVQTTEHGEPEKQ